MEDYEPRRDLPDDVREACELTIERDAPFAPYAEALLEIHGYEP